MGDLMDGWMCELTDSGWGKKVEQNEVQSTRAESTHKGVNYHLKDTTQTQQRPESPMVPLTWHAFLIAFI